MYNLLVGFLEGTAFSDRVVEYTEDVARQYVTPNGRVDPSRLLYIQSLVMPEVQDGASQQVARVRHIESLILTGRVYSVRFVLSPALPEISSDQIEDVSRQLGIADFEFYRTHWAVKDVDLYRVLHESVLG